MVINGITVTADSALTNEEISSLVMEENNQWLSQNRVLGRVELKVEDDNVVIQGFEKSPIRRVRRITGYLSNLENFNEAKHSECISRVDHSAVG